MASFLESTSEINQENVLDDSATAVRNRFFEYIYEYNPYKYPKNEDELNNILAAFRKNNKHVKQNYSYFRTTYRKGQVRLVLKAKHQRKFLKVIVLENVFDIIKEAHMNLNHGTKEYMSIVLGKDYLIPINWIQHFIDLCHFCNSKPSKLITNKGTLCYVNGYDLFGAEICIRNIMNTPDNGFHCVLIYVDRTTHYSVLRPMRAETEDEIAIELLKIFVDFDPPQKIGVSASLKMTVYKAMELLRSIELPFELPVIYSNIHSDVLALSMANILRKDIGALCEIDEKYWAISIGSLQWKLNLEGHGVFESRFVEQASLKSQYHAHFGIDLRQDIPKSGNKARVESKKAAPCLKCLYPVYKSYSCVVCKLKPFHFTCCQRTVVKDSVCVMKVLTMCVSCGNE